jgi:hypothetical protein
MIRYQTLLKERFNARWLQLRRDSECQFVDNLFYNVKGGLMFWSMTPPSCLFTECVHSTSLTVLAVSSRFLPPVVSVIFSHSSSYLILFFREAFVLGENLLSED